MTNQCCSPSNDSNSNQTSPSSSSNTIQYGPITVRICRKEVPTLENGRRSRNLALVGEEAVKREKRRERNREAARKLKEKRQLIEDELNRKIKQLESQRSFLQNHVELLHQRQQHLLYQLNNQELNEIDEILLDVPDDNNNNNNSPEDAQYSIDMKLYDDAFEEVINAHLQALFDSIQDN